MTSRRRPQKAAQDPQYAALPTEALLPAARELDRLSTVEVVRLLAREERRSVEAVRRAAPQIARAADLAAHALAGGGRLIYAGAGTSGRLGALDAAECPPTFGSRPGQVVAVLAGGPRAMRRAVEGAEDRAAEAARALGDLAVDERDLVVAIAASGVTPFARAALDEGRRRGAATVLVTCAPAAAQRLGARADVVVGLEVGPEVLAGSTRLKAGTATKLALNAISTAAMIRRGKVYGPYMVDVRATNDKLRARARRMLARLADVDLTDARGAALVDETLLAADGHVKTAVVMLRRGMTRRDAQRLLRAADGHLRRVVGAPPPTRASGKARR